MPSPNKKTAVYAVADKLTPRLRRQWLEAVASLQDAVTIDLLAEAVLHGAVSGAIGKRIETLPTALRSALATIAQVFEDSATRTEQDIAARLSLEGAFDIVNARAVEAARLHGAQLVVEITQDVRESIRAVIARAVQDGIAPRDAARLIRPLVGLTERQAMAVVNYRFALGDIAADKLQAAANRYAAKLHRQRADLIARTEVIRAANAGQQAAWEAAQAQGLLLPGTKKRWLSAADERRCPTCQALDRQSVDLHAQFASILGPLDGPPAHPACRCSTSLVIEAQKVA